MFATEDEEVDDLDDTDEDFELNKAFVNALFDEIDELRMQVRVPYSAASAPHLSDPASYSKQRCVAPLPRQKPVKKLWKRWRKG